MNFENNATLDVLDILFANRNKSYGAYQLRKNYNKRLITAIVVTIFACLVATVMARLQLSGKHDDTSLDLIGHEVSLKKIEVKEQPIVKPIHINSSKPHHALPPTIKVTPPVIVDDNFVSTPPAPNDEIDRIKIDVTTTAGVGDNNVMPIEKGTGKAETPVTIPDYNKVFHTVEQEAKFPGGADAWKTYLERNLRQDVPTDNGAPVGNYTAIISFLVNKEGNISDVKIESDPGYGTAAEAVRVIEHGPRWNPAVQNGNPVLYRQTQAITFVVTEVN